MCIIAFLFAVVALYQALTAPNPCCVSPLSKILLFAAAVVSLIWGQIILGLIWLAAALLYLHKSARRY